MHKGKESYPTRVWNIGCGPNGQIISCPPSMGGARNDKTLAHYDPLMQALKLNTRYGHLKFELYDKGGGDGMGVAAHGYMDTLGYFEKSGIACLDTYGYSSIAHTQYCTYLPLTSIAHTCIHCIADTPPTVRTSLRDPKYLICVKNV